MSWISVTERLPDHNRECLCLGERNRMFVGVYTSGHQIEYEPDEDDDRLPDEFEKEREKWFLQPGWYEEEEQMRSDYDFNWFKRVVSFWRPLPERP